MNPVLRRYFAYQFFFSLLLWVPIFVEFQRQLGLPDERIFNIQSIYYIVFAFLEIPTGFLADRFGTRPCLKASGLTLVAANLLPILQPNYDGMLWHFMLIALARSLNSGASSAYLYDYLRLYDDPGQYKEWEGKARAYGLFGKIICWSVVGFLMSWHLMLPYALTAVAAAFSFVFAARLPVYQIEQSSQVESGLHWRGMSKRLRQSPRLFFVMVQGIALFVMVRILQVNLFQPILSDKNFRLESFGIVMAFMTLFEAIGSAKTRVLAKKWSDTRSVTYLSLLMAVAIGLIPLLPGWSTLAALGIFSLVTGLAFPVQRQLMNDAIGASPFRATLLSIESILDRTVCAIAAMVIGDYLEAGRLNAFLWQSAGGIALVMIILAPTLRSKRIG